MWNGHAIPNLDIAYMYYSNNRLKVLEKIYCRMRFASQPEKSHLHFFF